MANDERSPKIYTRTGDKGKTSLIGGARVSKSHLRLDAYGTVDELNSVIGVLMRDLITDLSQAPPGEADVIHEFLTRVQNDLFNIGSQLACEDDTFRSQLPGVTPEQIEEFEKEMDRYSAVLKPLRNFILPGGARSAGMAHVARTVCRRTERLCVALSETLIERNEGEVDPLVIKYINRLSDYLFVLARYLNHLLQIDEPIWGTKKS